MFKKILIANRGEIALRIIYACRELGVKTVVAHSQADEHSLPVRFADEEVCIGPASSQDSYLNVPAVITAAEITGADAIHPGYGFLAESAYLAEACDACRITFIGPSVDVLRLLGDKSRARRAMRKAGLPVVPGSESVEDVAAARRAARRLGYPVIIKATSGGGGRGMRVVWNADDLQDAFLTARREAEAAFGDARVYLEIYVEEPRHIEFQILADEDGATVHLGERECSVQRRYQKFLEIAPAPNLDESLRDNIVNAA
ncbi:MAG: biotin carboxylase N-terminal domain-containing protein, partial [Vicinamibacterales bacterium]|nr:biotin carboxylase N-terminal domain-containing protein [Vicinamibacterales bacterium]